MENQNQQDAWHDPTHETSGSPLFDQMLQAARTGATRPQVRNIGLKGGLDEVSANNQATQAVQAALQEKKDAQEEAIAAGLERAPASPDKPRIPQRTLKESRQARQAVQARQNPESRNEYEVDYNNEEKESSPIGEFLVGGGLMAFGIIATMVSMSGDDSGGYTLWWGAILFGFISIVKGLLGLAGRR